MATIGMETEFRWNLGSRGKGGNGLSNIFNKTEIFSHNSNIFSQHASFAFANYWCSGSTPKQRQLVRTVSTDNYKEDSSSLAAQDAKNVNLSRQNKFIKGEYFEY